MVEAFDNVGAEEETSTTGRETPAVDFVGVGPEKITHGAFMRDFLFAVKEPDFVDCVD